jgi:hypothetical protein
MRTELDLETDMNADGGEAAALAGYQIPSSAAIVSLLLGLAAPLGILNSLLLVVPLAGVAVSLFALRRIAASDGALIGRKAALIGLFLSIASGAGVLTHKTVTREFRVAQATETAREWIALVLAGDTEKAYWLATGVPIPDPDRPEQFGSDGNPYLKYVEDATIKALLAAGPDADVRHVATVAYSSAGGGEYYVRQRYVVTPHAKVADGATERLPPINLPMQLHRTRTVGATYKTWRANAIPDPDAQSL